MSTFHWKQFDLFLSGMRRILRYCHSFWYLSDSRKAGKTGTNAKHFQQGAARNQPWKLTCFPNATVLITVTPIHTTIPTITIYSHLQFVLCTITQHYCWCFPSWGMMDGTTCRFWFLLALIQLDSWDKLWGAGTKSQVCVDRSGYLEGSCSIQRHISWH